MTRKTSRKGSVSVQLILLACLCSVLASKAALAQNAYDRGTPAESKGGQSSLSTYAPDKIETVNLANGNLNLHMPLVTIGGRGSAAYTVALTYNSKLWSGEHQVEDVTQHPGPTVKIHHFATTYDDGNMTRKNLIPLGSGWSICKGPSIRARKIGIDPITCLNVVEGTDFKYALTKVWIVLPDGSEIEMRDVLTEGAPFLVQNPCDGTFDRSRGRVWHSTDGSAITYVTDVENGVGLLVPNFSGWVFLADGSRMRIGFGGRCKQIIDRNGNNLDIDYDDTTAPGSVTYTDELGRQVIVQPVINQSFEVTGATVTIKGYNPVADRIVYVDGGTIGTNLRSDSQTTHAIYNSDTDINGVHDDTDPDHVDMFPGSDNKVNKTVISGERAVTQLRLLDGRQFHFRYNRFGELAEIVYPGGGVSQIDYQAYGSTICDGGGPLNLQLNRRVTERRTMSDGVTVDATWTYARGFGTIDATTYPTVTVEAHQGGISGALLISEKHYFLALDAEYRTCSALLGSNGTAYEKFENARELQVDRLTGSGTQIDARDWQQTNVVWSFDPSYANDPNHGQENPPNDPRVVTEDTTLENGKLKRVRYNYDGFNNVTRVREYDFGQGAQGTLLRDTTRTYLSNQNGYCYTNLNGVDGSCGAGVYATVERAIHRRRLLLNETITNSLTSAIEAYAEYEYDNYVNEGAGGNHAPIQTNPGMIRYDGTWFSPFAVDKQPRGNLTQVKRLISGSPSSGTYATSYSQYDEAGNVVRTIDPRGNPTTIAYSDNFGDGSNPDVGSAGTNGATFAFATSATNALGQVVKTQYDYTRGVLTGVKDPNLVITRSEYGDPYDRPTRVTAAYGLAAATKIEMSYPSAGSNQTTMSKQLDSTRWLAYKTTYDGFGRPLTANEAEDGTHASVASFTIFSKHIYDGLGRVKFATNPYRASSATTDGWTRPAYDLAGRVINVATFSGGPDSTPPEYPATTGTGVTWTGSVTTAYASEQTTVQDQAVKKRRSIVDGLGRLVRVDEPDSSGNLDIGNPPQPVQPTSYSYDARGNLKTVTQGTQPQRTFSYDLLSRLMSASNPESGSVNYTYDANSNLQTKTDARNVVTTFTYDGLNRLTNRTYSGPAPGGTTPAVAYVYDTLGAALNGKGRLTSVSSSVSSYSYGSYDVMGRVVTGTQSTDGQNYAMSYQYNLAGAMTSETYPSGRVMQTDYDNAGRFAGVKRQGTEMYYASGTQYTANGAVKAMALGNGRREVTTFNSRLQPTQIALDSNTANVNTLGLTYGYGTTTNNGNVMSQSITVPGSGGLSILLAQQSYTYDALNRLATATESGGSGWSQTYDYDRYGNRAVRSGSYIPLANTSITPQSANSTDYTAFDQGTNRLSQAKFPAVLYDNAGSLTRDAAAIPMTYDAENRLKNFNNGTGQYFYDGDGRRVKKIDSSGTTVFVYNVAGQLIAEYKTGTPAAGDTSYLTTDHLGSTRLVTDSGGNVKARYDYLPFGEEIESSKGGRGSVTGYGGVDSTKQKFTQKERDNESGLDYFLARYYSAAQGRFTSPDEFAGEPDEFWAPGSGDPEKQALPYADITNPQSLNKYQYVFNNPLRYVDPDGHQEGGSFLDKLRQLAELLGLKQPSPMPDPGKQRILQQQIPGTGGMTFDDGLKVELAATKQAAENLQKINELIDPTGGAAGTYVGKQAGLRSNSDVAIAVAAGALNFASPGKALGHFAKHSGEFGGALKNAVQYVLGARAHIGSATSDVVRYQNAAGKVLVYNAKSNEFATHTGKTIHTYFKPTTGQKYVDDVIKREGYKRIP